MVVDFSVSQNVNGLQRTAWDAEKITQRIAAQGARTSEENAPAVAGLDPGASVVLFGQVEASAEAETRGYSSEQDDEAKKLFSLFA